jgi:hypothetical protein
LLSIAGFEQHNINSPLFGYNRVSGEGTTSEVKALFAVAPNTDWYGVGGNDAVFKDSVQDCANYAVQKNGDGFIYHGMDFFHSLHAHKPSSYQPS